MSPNWGQTFRWLWLRRPFFPDSICKTVPLYAHIRHPQGPSQQIQARAVESGEIVRTSMLHSASNTATIDSVPRPCETFRTSTTLDRQAKESLKRQRNPTWARRMMIISSICMDEKGGPACIKKPSATTIWKPLVRIYETGS